LRRKIGQIFPSYFDFYAQLLLAHAEDGRFDNFFTSFLIFISITFVSRMPQNRLLLVQTKIYQRPRPPNRLHFVHNRLSQSYYTIPSVDEKIF